MTGEFWSNTAQPAEDFPACDWTGIGWDGRVPTLARHIQHPRVVGPPQRCPRCGDRMREVPGFDDYCPPCRLQEELATEREVVAAQSPPLVAWFGEWSDGAASP